MRQKNRLKIVFVSNYFSHHQKPLSDALAQLCDYSFVELSEMTDERRDMGWGLEEIPDYVCSHVRTPEAALERIEQADVVIAGNVPPRLLRECVRRNQTVLRYSERPLKKGIEPLKYLPRLVKWHWQNPFWKPVYLLCASAYTASDYGRFGLFRGKAYRWGYFPELKKYENLQQLLARKKKASILWAGRFLRCKHPDDALRLAEKLKAAGYSFQLNLIGSGPMEEQLTEQIQSHGLEDCVHLLGSMAPGQVRARMEESEIFLFTSDREEGWGAVVNEAMNSACCVIACEAAGSVPYLVRDGQNGITYRSGDAGALYEKVCGVLDADDLAARLGAAAYNTMVNLWNGEIAAARLVELARRILTGEKSPDLYADGPCSKETAR